MFRKKRKWGFGLYALLVMSLSIGWYPENPGKKAEKSIAVAAVSAETDDNSDGGILETDPTERLAGMQRDEQARRAVKIVKKETPYRFRLNKKSRRILERIVEAEAGDQDIKGRQMVANVVLNRVKSEKFPNTVRAVVFAKRQFSPVANGSYDRVTVSERTREAVEKALKEKDNTGGALYFMYRAGSDSANVTWFDRALTRLYRYGCHEFFC